MKIYIDIDGVLCNFQQGVIDYCINNNLNLEGVPKHWTLWNEWYHMKDSSELWKYIANDYWFWSKLPKYDDAYIDFPIVGYCTARRIPNRLSYSWLLRNGFPEGKIISVDDSKKKLELLKQEECEIFIDDKPDTVRQFIADGSIKCFLRDRPFNRSCNDLDPYRIICLSQIKQLCDI